MSLGRTIFAVFVALSAIAPTKHASASAVTKSNHAGCAIELKGEIKAGDLDQLRPLADRLGLTDGKMSTETTTNAADEALCLDSPGGQYVEGRQISAFLHEHGIATRLVQGAECYSACAFIFMAGRLKGDEGDELARYMHIDSKLGFHAPYFALGEGVSLSGAEVTKLVTLNSQLIADFIDFGSFKSPFSAEPIFAMSLVSELLASGPDQMRMVNTVEDIARWSITVEGNSKAGRLNRRGLDMACQNFQAWNSDEKSEPSDLPRYGNDTVKSVSINGKKWKMIRIDTGGYADRYCEVGVAAGDFKSMPICSRDEFNGVIHGDCSVGMPFWIPWYYGLPPQTPLSALAPS